MKRPSIWLREYRLPWVVPVGLALILLLLYAPGLLLWLSESKRPRRELTLLRNCATALLIYEEGHGTLPYDERGWQYALYKLKEFGLPASAFEGDANDEQRSAPFYDDELEALVGSDYVYLNRPGMTYETDADRIVLCERSVPGKRTWRCCTTGGYRPLVGQDELPPGKQDPLGLWVSASGGRQVLTETRPARGGPASEPTQGNGSTDSVSPPL